MVLEGCLWWGR